MDYKKFESVFETSPSLDKINYTLAVLTPRKTDNGNSIKYYGKYYQPYLDQELLVTIDEQVLDLENYPEMKDFLKNLIMF